jgi:peptide/nickel transport system substrate-binding protein
MSVNEKPFDDVRVRQALKHSIDRNALQKVVLQGRGVIMNDQPVAPFSPLWANIPPLAYDVEKAKALLAEAGYPNGLEVTLTIAEITPGIMDAAVVIQESAKAAGITINLNRSPVGAYWAEQYMQVPFFVSYWPLESEPDPQLSLVYVSDGIFNESGWFDARVDTLISESRGSRDLATRKQQSAEIQQIISSEGANIIPYSMPIIMAARDTVRDLIPGQFIYPQFIWLAPKS